MSHLNRIPAFAVLFLELLEFGKAYGEQIIKNSKALGKALLDVGVSVLYADEGISKTRTVLLHQIKIGQLDLEAIKRRTPMERIGKMEDLTGPAIFLASRESDFMCGQALIIDGGWMAYGFLQM